MTCNIITDYIQDEYDYSSYSIILDIILLLIIVYFYYTGNNLIVLAQLFIIIVFARFILSALTNIQDKTTRKHHYQLDGRLALFLILTSLMYIKGQFNNIHDAVIIIGVVFFSFFTITTKSANTSDTLFTILLVYAILNIPYLSKQLRVNA